MPSLTSSEVQSLRSGLQTFFSNLHTQLKTDVLAESLPIVGTTLNKNAAVANLANLAGKIDAALDKHDDSGADSETILAAVNGAVNAANFEGVVEIVHGGEFRLDFSKVGDTTTTAAGVDSALTLPGLDLDLTAAGPSATATLAYGFNFAIGLESGGFYVEPTSAQAIDLGIKVDTAGPKTIAGKLGILPVTIDIGKQTLLDATAGITFGTGGDGVLTTAEMAGAFLDGTILSGVAAPTVAVRTNLGGTAAPVPSIAANVAINWNLAGATLDASAANEAFGAAPTIDFKNVGIDAASFFQGTVSKFAENLLNVGGPVFTVAETLTTKVPDVLGTILKTFGFTPPPGGELALIDLIADPSNAQAVRSIAALGTTLKTISGKAVGGNLIDLGGFTFTTDGGGLDARDDAADFLTAVLGAGTSNLPGNAIVSEALEAARATLGNVLSFPILEDPSQAYKFLLGGTANLVQYDPAPVSFGISGEQFFPIFPLVFARLGYGGGFSLDFGAGYDTSGISRFITTGNSNALLDGFYLLDAPGNEMTFNAFIEAGVAAGIPAVFTVGVDGGIKGTLGLELKDDFSSANFPHLAALANDGKVSFQELESIGFSPFKAFSANGRISAYLTAYLDSFFYSKEKNLGSITLFDFDTETKKANGEEVPTLARKDGNVVHLNIGSDAHLRQSDANGNLGESILVYPAPGGLTVASPQAKTRLNANLPSLGGDITFKGSLIVQGNGGGGDDVLRASENLAQGVSFSGAAGNDLLQGGAGKDFLSGGGDIDKLEGFGGRDTLFGGNGNDNLSGGDGDDDLHGDSGSDVLFGGEGNDSLYAVDIVSTQDLAGMKNALLGGPGTDKLFGSTGADILDGGPGKDIVTPHGGGDDIFVDDKGDQVLAVGPQVGSIIYSRAAHYVLPFGFSTLKLINDKDADAENGGEGLPLVHRPISGEGNSLNNVIYGNLAGNTIRGMGGDDTIHGDSDFIDSGNGTFTSIYIEAIVGGGRDILDGGIGDDDLYGNSGNDSLTGGDGNDELFGGNGDDFLDGGPGNDRLEGGPGNDTYLLENFSLGGDQIIDSDGFNIGFVISSKTVHLDQPAYGGLDGIRFFAGGNAYGTDANEFFSGGGGVNKFYGYGGNDDLEGGKGDYLSGGYGMDNYRVFDVSVKIVEVPEEQLRGDTVYTYVNFKLPLFVEDLWAVGDQFIVGLGNIHDNSLSTETKGGARLYGMEGNDQLFAAYHAATLIGGPGDDNFLGSDEDDVIYGYIDGTFFSKDDPEASDNDHILAAGGDDLIFAGRGEDFIDADEGDDEIHTDGKGTTEIFGGDGNDRYYLDSLDGSWANVRIHEEDTNGTDTIFSILDVNIGPVFFNNMPIFPELERVENITLLDLKQGNQILGALNATGNSLGNEIHGNRRDNVLAGREGNDRLFGEAGNDTLYGEAGLDTLEGGEGNDTLHGLENETQQADKLRGGKGDDTYFPGAQDEILEKAGEGFDRVSTDANTFTLPQHVEQLTMTGPAFGGYGNAQNNTIFGTELANSILGHEGDDTLSGGGGADVMNGGPGADKVIGGDGIDTLYGGDGNDIMEGNRKGDTLSGGGGNDKMYGHSQVLLTAGNPDAVDDNFRDVLYGDGGDDEMFGQGGNDAFIGGPGNDTMVGGKGDDTYDVDSPNDVVKELPGEGDDMVNSSVSFTIPANVDRLSLKGFANLSATGSKDIDFLYGNAGNNLIKGLGSRDHLFGDLGNDELLGGPGDDVLRGDESAAPGGNDILDGGEGNDDMRGAAGDDTYRVDSLGDQVVENAGEGTDTIETTIGLLLPAHVENLKAIGSGKGAVYISGGKIITGLTLTGNTLDNVITGGDFVDFIDGGAGEDLLIGGKNSDVYIVDNIDDRISELKDGGGSDEARSLAFEFTLPENVEQLTILPGAALGPGGFSFGIGNLQGNTLRGNDDKNILFGDAGNDSLYGNGGEDILAGGDDHDYLDGGTGPDTMQGGAGDDFYIVRDVEDVLEEDPLSGQDIAEILVDGWQLGAGSHVEEIRLANLAGLFSVAGNDLANVIVGNKSDNSLRGGGGSDTLKGGEGADFLVGSSGYAPGEIDVLTGGPGADRFLLGDLAKRYADNDDLTAGLDSYAKITDFNPAQGDRVILGFGDYLLVKTTLLIGNSSAPRAGRPTSGMGIYLDADGDGVLDRGGEGDVADDLIAFMPGFSTSADLADLIAPIG